MADEDDDGQAGDGVHRLVDMVVEEVSLVDRAANQRRFLIVKRRFDMASEGAGGEAAGQDKDGTEGGGTVTGVTPEAMAAVTEALAALTDLVATTASEKAFPPPKAPKKPGGDGADDKDDEEDKDEEDKDEEETDDEAEAERRRKAAESVQALLGQVKAALGRLQAAVTSPAQKRDARPGGSDAVMAKLDQLVASLGTIEGRLKAQDERLGKVEKNVGLPASRSPEGRTEPDDDDEVSWPLDLNAPMDRASVDKSISFHEAK